MRLWHDPLLAALSLAILIGLLVWCSKGPSPPSHEALVEQVQTGLLNLYDKAKTTQVAEGNNGTPTGNALWAELAMASSENPPRAVLPASITSSDIFFSEAKAGPEKLLCVVRVGSSDLYGITGNRKFRAVTEDQLERWPHIRNDSIVLWKYTPSLDLVLLRWYLRIALALSIAALLLLRYLRQNNFVWEPFGILENLVRRGMGPAMLLWPIVLALLIYYWRKDGWYVVRNQPPQSPGD